MKTPIAARFSAFTLLAALLYALLVMASGLCIVGVSFPRQGWLLENAMLWKPGLWLWLAMIFGWMGLAASLLWAHLPAHSIAPMLQSGLLVIGATLSIDGVTVWMAGLSASLALPAIGAGLLLLPSPWLLTFPWHLVAAAVCWLTWALSLARRSRLPSASPEMR
ncbi:MAG: hypothetical protein IAE81_09275 [Caldilineaceae bacterium]|jgi:hypothetical protein|nr:hypothetical protein [Caldilineaceae bacterium]